MTLSLHKWAFSKLIFAISRREFSGAIDVMREQIEKETGQKPDLKITFYKASKTTHEIPEWNIPEFLGEVRNPETVPRALWRKANLVQASFNTAATSDLPELKAMIRAKGHDVREMYFDVEPQQIGDRIGRSMLNDYGPFAFWSRGVRY